MPLDRKMFVPFLIAAKLHTYARQGGQVGMPPFLPGARQLEYHEPPLLYRDIYFGENFFVGQETVYYETRPVWAMGYAGGILPGVAPELERGQIYAFLREALRQVEMERPYRGPESWCREPFTYTNHSQGDVERFWGIEVIGYRERPVYELRYSGGWLL